MDMQSLITAAATGVLGGGFLSSLGTLYAVRRKTPVERDSIIVTSAESAVAALATAMGSEKEARERDVAQLKAALADRDEHIERLERELIRKDERIDALERRLDVLQDALDQARREVMSLRTPRGGDAL